MAESYTKPEREKQGACVSLSISRLNIHQPRHRSPVVDAEEELLSKGPWSQFLENEKFHSVEENTSAHERCKQLLVGGVAAVDWIELCGQK